MRFTWDEVKRKRNLKDHGLDFVDAPHVFDGATFTYEDDRFSGFQYQASATGGLGYKFFDSSATKLSVSVG